MRSVLLMLMLSITHAQSSASCPATCVVCSEDAIICQKLSSIIGAPDTTKALMLTDGWIDSVDDVALSAPSNMRVLGLSNNAIATIAENAFWNLTVLQTLLLDHNRLSSRSLDGSTFSRLPRLETLQLGNNALRHIDGSWFGNAGALRTLQLEGNLLTGLNASTFTSADLQGLETLDLSDNLIAHVGSNSFLALRRLRSLDLSRNRLRNAPADAFSYLAWLSALNLELNRWDCTCELRDLSSFLSSYVQAPDKVLYNGRRMVCTSADNPAVSTVLELTEANCVPPNQNITVQVEARGSVMPQRYARDVALAAVFFFAGGVGITLGVLWLVSRKLGSSKSFRLWQRKSEAEEGKGAQGSAQWDFAEDSPSLSAAYDAYNTKQTLPNSTQHGGRQPWDRESVPYDVRHHRAERSFTCHHCSSAVPGPGVAARRDESRGRDAAAHAANHEGARPSRLENWPTQEEGGDWRGHTPHLALESKVKDIRVHRQYQRQSGGVRTHTFNNEDRDLHHRGNPNVRPTADRKQRLSRPSHVSPSQRNASSHRSQTHRSGNHINGHPKWKEQPEDLSVYPTVSCGHCHTTYEYRQAESKDQNISSFRTNIEEETSKCDGTAGYTAMLHRETLNYSQFNVGSHGDRHARELGVKLGPPRSVTFDLMESKVRAVDVPKRRHHGPGKPKTIKPKSPGYKHYQRPDSESYKTTKSNVLERGDYSKSNKHKIHSSRSLKVKLNLNPLRKSRVHPKKSLSHEKLLSEHSDANKTPKNTRNDQLRTKGGKAKNNTDSCAETTGGTAQANHSKKDKPSHENKLSQPSLRSSKAHDKPSKRSASSGLKTRDADADQEEEIESGNTGSVEQKTKNTPSPQRKHPKRDNTGTQSAPADDDDDDDDKECRRNVLELEEEGYIPGRKTRTSSTHKRSASISEQEHQTESDGNRPNRSGGTSLDGKKEEDQGQHPEESKPLHHPTESEATVEGEVRVTHQPAPLGQDPGEAPIRSLSAEGTTLQRNTALGAINHSSSEAQIQSTQASVAHTRPQTDSVGPPPVHAGMAGGLLPPGHIGMASLPPGQIDMASLPLGHIGMASLPPGHAGMAVGSLPAEHIDMAGNSLPPGHIGMASLPPGHTGMASIPPGQAGMAGGLLPPGQIGMASLPPGHAGMAVGSLPAEHIGMAVGLLPPGQIGMASLPPGHAGMAVGSLPAEHIGMAVGLLPPGHIGMASLHHEHAGMASLPHEHAGMASLPHKHAGMASLPPGQAGMASLTPGQIDMASLPLGHIGMASLPPGHAGMAVGSLPAEHIDMAGNSLPPGHIGMASLPPGHAGMASIPPGQAGMAGGLLPPGQIGMASLPPGHASMAVGSLPAEHIGMAVGLLPPGHIGMASLHHEHAGMASLPHEHAGMASLPHKHAGMASLPPGQAGMASLTPEHAGMARALLPPGHAGMALLPHEHAGMAVGSLPPGHAGMAGVSPVGTLHPTDSQPLTDSPNLLPASSSEAARAPSDGENLSNNNSMNPAASTVVQEYLSPAEGSPKRKIRLILPEKAAARPQTALEKKIR